MVGYNCLYSSLGQNTEKGKNFPKYCICLIKLTNKGTSFFFFSHKGLGFCVKQNINEIGSLPVCLSHALLSETIIPIDLKFGGKVETVNRLNE